MSRGSYKDADAKCPYYRARDGTSVTCEGYIESTYITLRCITGERCEEWTRGYCDSMSGYRRCPLQAGRDESVEIEDLHGWNDIVKPLKK